MRVEEQRNLEPFTIKRKLSGGTNMFQIAVCDDEPYFRQCECEFLEDYMKKTGTEFSVDLFCSGEEMMALGIELAKYQVIFLDINMLKVDGITVARKIREVNREVYIVFVTAYVKYTLEGYKVDAIRYLLKNNKNFSESMEECMNAIMEKMNYRIVKKAFDFNQGRKEISIDRILYIESKLHKLEFHVMEEKMNIYTLYATLNEVEEMLTESKFIRIHQSYLVNMAYIKELQRYEVMLDTGKILGISKARYPEVRNQYIAYRGEL